MFGIRPGVLAHVSEYLGPSITTIMTFCVRKPSALFEAEGLQDEKAPYIKEAIKRELKQEHTLKRFAFRKE
jgi:hypothetical protein